MIKAELNGEQMICEYTGSGETVGEEITSLFSALADYAGPGWALFNAHFMLETARRMAQDAGLEVVLDSFTE